MREREIQEFDADLSDIGRMADDDIPLAKAALRAAMLEYPTLDVRRWLGEIDELAERATSRADSGTSSARLAALDETLFEEAGFHGNVLDYYDPQNSFLNDVIERRTGIPITLSILYIEAGRRLGLDLRGIGFPGHFLVGHFGRDGVEIVDPFNRGRRLTRGDCALMLEDAHGATLDERMLEPVGHRQILVRMLTNLKMIYMQRSDVERTLGAIDRILQVSPASLTELRDRGLVLLQADQPNRALDDLRAYLEASPAGADAEAVRAAIGSALRELARFN